MTTMRSDVRENGITVLKYLLILIAQDGKPMFPQKFLSPLVVLFCLGMKRAVQFDDQFASNTKKINDEWSKWSLSTKFQSTKLPVL